MNWVREIRKATANRHFWLGGMLLGLFLGVLALTISEAWHRAMHADACEPEHQCAVTMLHSGQVDVPVVEVTPVCGKVWTGVALAAKLVFVPVVDFNLPPSCGPPALLS
jgi:disulfide bond formation protein DsbB